MDLSAGWRNGGLIYCSVMVFCCFATMGGITLAVGGKEPTVTMFRQVRSGECVPFLDNIT